MHHLYQESNGSPRIGLCLALGLVLALLIFLLVPMTQSVLPEGQVVRSLDEVVLSVAPPPPPPPEDPPAAPPQKVVPLPELKEPLPLPTLEQLELGLNPGTGGAFNIEVGLDLNFQTETAENLIDLFGFSELDEIPRLIREGLPKMRQSSSYMQLQRKNVKKAVTLVVVLDERGYVEVTDVLSYTHSELIPVAKQVAENSRFSSPLLNGKPVRAKYPWPLEF